METDMLSPAHISLFLVRKLGLGMRVHRTGSRGPTTILSSMAALALPVRTVENAPVVLSMLFSILVICRGATTHYIDKPSIISVMLHV